MIKLNAVKACEITNTPYTLSKKELRDIEQCIQDRASFGSHSCLIKCNNNYRKAKAITEVLKDAGYIASRRHPDAVYVYWKEEQK